MLRPLSFLWSLVVASWPVVAAHVRASLARLRRYEFAEIVTDLSTFSARWLIRCVQLLVVACVLVSSASAIYGGFYYLIMPAKVLQRPLYFDYGVHASFVVNGQHPSPYVANTADVHLPRALLELTTGVNGRDQWTYADDVESSDTKILPLTHMTKYDIVLELEFAQSATNDAIGMFMVRTHAVGDGNRTLAVSARPTFVRSSHWAVDLASQALWVAPTLLLGYDAALTQRRTITAMNGFEERRVRAVEQIHVELSHPQVQVVAASVSILAQLSGLRYLMYHWCVSTAVVAIANIVLFQVFWCFVLYLYVTFPHGLPSDAAADEAHVVEDDEDAGEDDEMSNASSKEDEDVPQVYESELILPEPDDASTLRQRRA